MQMHQTRDCISWAIQTLSFAPVLNVNQRSVMECIAKVDFKLHYVLYLVFYPIISESDIDHSNIDVYVIYVPEI